MTAVAAATRPAPSEPQAAEGPGPEVKEVKIEDKLYLNRWLADEESHLIVMDQGICLTRCGESHSYACTIFCPASVYKFEGNMISVMYEGCLECGACRLGCPYRNIEWHFPRGGYGVTYKFG